MSKKKKIKNKKTILMSFNSSKNICQHTDKE